MYTHQAITKTTTTTSATDIYKNIQNMRYFLTASDKNNHENALKKEN